MRLAYQRQGHISFRLSGDSRWRGTWAQQAGQQMRGSQWQQVGAKQTSGGVMKVGKDRPTTDEIPGLDACAVCIAANSEHKEGRK
jgi:hypothetical protein